MSQPAPVSPLSTPERSPRGGRRSWAVRTACAAALLALGSPAGRAEGIGPIVRAFCLSAFESEMAQAGKRAPQGMADFACGCVADRISSGSSIDAARVGCRDAAARRYRI